MWSIVRLSFWEQRLVAIDVLRELLIDWSCNVLSPQSWTLNFRYINDLGRVAPGFHWPPCSRFSHIEDLRSMDLGHDSQTLWFPESCRMCYGSHTGLDKIGVLPTLRFPIWPSCHAPHQISSFSETWWRDTRGRTVGKVVLGLSMALMMTNSPPCYTQPSKPRAWRGNNEEKRKNPKGTAEICLTLR